MPKIEVNIFKYVTPITLALAFFLNYTLQYFGVWVGFENREPPMTAGFLCDVCGQLQYVDKRHGDILQHILRPLVGSTFIYGFFILFRGLSDQSQP